MPPPAPSPLTPPHAASEPGAPSAVTSPRGQGPTPDNSGHPLPTIHTPLSQSQVLGRLLTAAKRGRLPGYEPGGHGGLFSMAAHGHPFDAILIATYEPLPENGDREARREGEGGAGRQGEPHAATPGGRLVFRSRLNRKLPAIFAIVLLATVWPGVHFMDQLIPGEWGWIPTWWWYLPVTALPLPWVWRGLMKRSRGSIDRSAREMIGRIAREIDGRQTAA
jgi:hypothetical protein